MTGTSARRLCDRAIDRVTPGRKDEGVALLSAILFMVIVAGLSIVLVSTVLAQMAPTALAQKRTSTIYAAQAGVQATLAILRTAAAAPDYAGKVYGNPGSLPCSVSQTNADGQADGLTYQVSISYYSADPTGQSAAWLAGTTSPSYLISCSPTGGLASAPKFAVVTGAGRGSTALGVPTASLGNRSISAIYKFKVSNVNVSGGRIWDANRQYCLQAPTTGSTPTFVAAAQCVTANDALQLWIYDTDYKIKLASTTTGGAAGICITGPATANGGTQNSLLQPCLGVTDPTRWNQLWSWTGSYSWQGQNQDISTGPSNYCLATGYSAGTNLVGKPLLVSNGCNGSFTPDSAVGAGAAGYNTHQLVNYKEFGRCADVTNEQIGSSFMISYPCKQDPTGTGAYLQWNHHWYYTEPASYGPPANPSLATSIVGPIYVNTSNVNLPQYCLQTPTSGSAPYFPTFVACNGSNAQKWTRIYNTGVYANSYWITDYYGRCLQTDPAQLFNGAYSEIDVAGCNGSDAQKWNAPSATSDSTVGGYKEIG